MIKDIVVNKMEFKLFFVESVCDDPQIIEQNIMVSHSKFMLCTIFLKNGESQEILKKKKPCPQDRKILSILAEQVSRYTSQQIQFTLYQHRNLRLVLSHVF
jgi:hypothetical protein